MRLLKEHALEAAVDPGFRLWDEAQSSFAKRVAVDGALDEFFLARLESSEIFLKEAVSARQAHL